jgi:hypothetical protein
MYAGFLLVSFVKIGEQFAELLGEGDDGMS